MPGYTRKSDKTVNKWNIQQLRTEYKKLQTVVSTRGRTIGGLKFALEFLLEHGEDAGKRKISLAPGPGQEVDVQSVLERLKKDASQKAEIVEAKTCGTCYEDYDNLERKPVAFQCGHMSCLECCQKMIQTSNEWKCPWCKVPVTGITPLFF
jgi:hypothetical protein